MDHDVAVFQAYPFKKGQKVRVEGPNRTGDWEVVGVTDTKVTLKCPISKKEFTWSRFCYFVEERHTQWPAD